jgi:hypothetical protein
MVCPVAKKWVCFRSVSSGNDIADDEKGRGGKESGLNRVVGKLEGEGAERTMPGRRFRGRFFFFLPWMVCACLDLFLLTSEKHLALELKLSRNSCNTVVSSESG